MKKQIVIIFTKFLAGMLFFNFILYRMAAAVLPKLPSLGVNRLFLNNSQQFLNEFRRRGGFFSYYWLGIRANWGTSYQSGESVWKPIQPYVGQTLLILLGTIVVVMTLSFLLFWGLMKIDRISILRYFQGNWLTYSFFILLLVPLFSTTGISWSYNPALNQNPVQTAAFWTYLLLLTIFGLFKTISVVAQSPIASEVDTDTLYPDNTSPRNPTVEISPLELSSIGIKATGITMLEMMIFLGEFQNIPGLGVSLFAALYIPDIPVLLAILFFLLLYGFVLNLLFDLLLMLVRSRETRSTQTLQPLASPKSGQWYGKLMTSIFIFIMLSASLLWFFTGYSIRILFLMNPNYVNIAQRNLSVTASHILGTDYLGRDRFSRLFYATGTFTIPVIVAIILRSTIVILITKVGGESAMDVKREIFDLFSSVPKYPLLVFIGFMIAYLTSTSFFLIGISITVSLLFWGQAGKRFLDMQRNRENAYRELVVYTMISAVIEYFMISYYVGASTLAWGSDIVNAINNFPTQHPLGFVTIIVFFGAVTGLYAFADSLRNKTV